jgi:hypothetical protein
MGVPDGRIPALRARHNGDVSIAELITAVIDALDGCP